MKLSFSPIGKALTKKGTERMRLRLAGAAAVLALATTISGVPAQAAPPTKQMEDLDRGLVSVRSGSGNLVSWRLLGTDPDGVAFNVYRGSTRVATNLTASTNYLDNGAAADASYTVRAVVGGTEQAASPASLRFTGGSYLDVPIQPPSGGTTPDGVAYTYSANDAGVGDLDGDGRYEIVLKWDPSNAKDNSQAGYTGNVYVDAYRLNGTRLWRIDLGRNIRAGAHYTQFQVYDYDGDGRAEVAMKTADGTRDGAGTVIGNANADHSAASSWGWSPPCSGSGSTGSSCRRGWRSSAGGASCPSSRPSWRCCWACWSAGSGRCSASGSARPVRR
jgi:hypothetical protein